MSQVDLERAMQTLAEAPAAGRLPEAHLVWQRAQARARRRQYERATLWTRVAERVAGAVLGVTAVVAGVALWPRVEVAMAGLDPGIERLLGAALLGVAAAALVFVRELVAED